MRKIIFSIILFSGVWGIVSCSSNYIANPSSNGNNSFNPKNPPTFNWGGTAPMSALIDGAPWVADAGSIVHVYSNPYHVFYGTGGGHRLTIWLASVAPGSTYSMGLLNTAQYMMWQDSIVYTGVATGLHNYLSYQGVAGSGGVQVSQCDTAGGYMKGLFYFQGVDALGQIRNITAGYFNFAD